MENNASELRRFIDDNKSKPGMGGKVYKALVCISTESQSIADIKTDIVIELLGYDGPFLKLIKSEIDGQLYPIKFFTKSSRFTFLDNGHLKITGTDKVNKAIGNYLVDIIV